MTVSEKIKFFRNKFGISQEEFAKLSGISLSTIKKVESNRMNPKPQQLQKFADAFGVSISLFNPVRAETVSDIMSLITQMDESVDIEFQAEYDIEGNPDPKTITLHFTHPAINRKLSDLMREREVRDGLLKEKEKYSDNSNEAAEIERMNNLLD